MDYEIDWNGNNAIIKMYGVVGFDEINFVNGLLYGDKRFEEMNYQLFDLSQVEQCNLSARDFEMLGKLDKKSSIWNKFINVAVVFSDDEMVKLMEFYISAMKETEWKIKVFQNFKDAIKWCKDEI